MESRSKTRHQSFKPWIAEKGFTSPASSIAATSSGVRSAFLDIRNSVVFKGRFHLRRSPTARYSSSRSTFEVVLLSSGELSKFHDNKVTYVTITTFFALTHENITCAGVALRRLAILASTESTGPPGQRVIGLKRVSPCELKMD